MIGLGIGNYIDNKRGLSKGVFDPTKINYQAIWTVLGKRNSDIDKSVPNLIDNGAGLNCTNFAWSLNSGYQALNQDLKGITSNNGTKGTTTYSLNTIKYTVIIEEGVDINTLTCYWKNYQNKPFKAKLTSNIPNLTLELRYIKKPENGGSLLRQTQVQQNSDNSIPEFTHEDFEILARDNPFLRVEVPMAKDDWFQLELIPEVEEGLFFDGVDDFFKSDKVLPQLADYTIIGDIEFLPDNISNSNKGVRKDSIFWQGERIYINSIDIPNNWIKDVIGFSSSGTIVTKTSSIVGLVGNLKPEQNYLTSFSFPQMNFRSLAIVPYTLNEAKIRVTYEYIKTLKANNTL